MSDRTVQPGFDLLRVRWIRRVVLSPLFPYGFQVLVLVAFVWLAVFGWGRFAPEGVPGKLYAKTNVVTLLIWGLWWPAMVWVAVCFGRAWCTVCPLELVANVTERLGRMLGVRQRRLGKLAASGVLILALYASIQMLVAGVHLHRVGAYTSIFLWALLAVAAVTGFFLKDRAFCRGFCPVGLLLGVYGRGAMLAVRPGSSEKCDACTEKACTRAARRTRLDARSCPSLLNPARLDSNADCLVCGQCMKACSSANMGLYLRRPFHPADVREPLASWPVTLFVMLVSGFVSYELCSEWSAAKSAFLWVPTHLTELVGLPDSGGWIIGAWMLFVFPAVAWLVLGGLTVLCRGARGLGEAWRRLALPLAVIVAAGHMAKGLAKVVSWAGYLPHTLRDPLGINTSLAISAKTISKPAHLLPMCVVSAVAVLLVLAMPHFALRESRLADPDTSSGRLAPIWLVALAFAFVIFGWGALC